MSLLDFDRYVAELDAETARLVALTHTADVNQQVATCPEWSLEQLVGHVGRGQRWAADMITQRVSAPIPMGEVVVPAGADARSRWLTESTRMLTDAVREAGPSQPVWTWQADKS